VEEVYFGCDNQAGEDNRNVARMALILAGFPYEVPAVTFNRRVRETPTALASQFYQYGYWKYIVLRPEALIATALWTMTAWAHEGATHSPILAAISVEPDSGKSSLLGVLRFLAPKPFVSVEPTGPSVYRTVDREHPTLIIDEADDLFYRKSDLRAIVNAGWSRGTRIPRQGRWYDPFCPKILGILGKTKLPRTIASRSIILKMWPKKPDEKAEDFAYADDPEFSTIRRKLARWAADNVRIIKDLKPPQPPGFNNRLSAACWWWLARAGMSVCDLPLSRSI